MTNLTHAHMNKIDIPTVLDSSFVQIKSWLCFATKQSFTACPMPPMIASTFDLI